MTDLLPKNSTPIERAISNAMDREGALATPALAREADAPGSAEDEARTLDTLVVTAQRRVERAKELLESTRLSLEQIVEKVGYVDVSAFRRLFVRHVGMSPAQYRQRFRRPTEG